MHWLALLGVHTGLSCISHISGGEHPPIFAMNGKYEACWRQHGRDAKGQKQREQGPIVTTQIFFPGGLKQAMCTIFCCKM